MKEAEEAIRSKDFVGARDLLNGALKLSKDTYIIQRLVFAIYKAAQPDEQAALFSARKVLQQIVPSGKLDSETLKLLGDIEYGLYETNDFDHLLRAKEAYEKLYAISPDYSIGIEPAYIIAACYF